MVRTVKTIRFHKSFKKQFARQSQKVQTKFWGQLELWQGQPFHPMLNHHVLTGKYGGLHSINITGDVRAIYDEFDDYIVIYLFIGTHSQLYR